MSTFQNWNQGVHHVDSLHMVSHHNFYSCIGNSLIKITPTFLYIWDFPGGSDGKESAYNAGDVGLTPGLGISPGEGNGPLQSSFLENSMDRGYNP